MMGNLLVALGLVAGMALSAVLFQWDSIQRASLATPAPAATASGAPATGPAPGPTPLASSQMPGEGVIQAGKGVYNSFCNACHPNGRAGLGPAVIGLSEEAVRAAVRQGKGSMPAFKEGQIPEAQMAELLAYVKSLK